MARKWIAQRIAALDPEISYDEIWKLSSAYRPNDFLMNLVYAVTFPHFFVRELDAIPLIDEDLGKILSRPDARAEDTSWKMQLWWHYGSDHEKTRHNVESINRLHEHYAKKYPESFDRNYSYIYTLCYEAAGMHRLFQRIGMKGFSENEKRAAVKYWGRMGTHFRNATSGEPLKDFPQTFDGIMEYMDRHEAEEIASHELGRAGTRAIMDQFANRYFPKLLHPIAKAWLASLYPDHVIRSHEVPRPSRPTTWLFRRLTALFFWFGDKVLPDPTDTFIERRQAKRLRAPFPASYSARSEVVSTAALGCPHLRGIAEEAATSNDLSSIASNAGGKERVRAAVQN